MERNGLFECDTWNGDHVLTFLTLYQLVTMSDSVGNFSSEEQQEKNNKEMFAMIKNGEDTHSIMTFIKVNIVDLDEENVDHIKERHAVSAAIAHGRNDLVGALLKEYKDIDWETCDGDGVYPMHLATKREGIILCLFCGCSFFPSSFSNTLLLCNYM